MQNYLDKTFPTGSNSLEKILEMQKMIDSLPDTTFPVVQATVGEKKMLSIDLKESSKGNKELQIIYHKLSEEEINTINIPAESTYLFNHNTNTSEIGFAYGGNNYRILIEK